MMISPHFEITGVTEKHMSKVFWLAYKNAFTKSTEFLFGKCFDNAPVGRTRKGGVNLRNALQFDYDWDRMEAFIGLPANSELEKEAFYTEYGTGERGQAGWTQFFDESMPNFTIPIVPLKAKAMHFVDENGKDVFLKKSRGQNPQAWMRRAFSDNKENVEKIWKIEFSDSKIRKLLHPEKI